MEQTLVAESVPPDSEISLVIAGQRKIRRLNREYRGKDRNTDVLAFAMTEQRPRESSFITAPGIAHHLGEVLISYPQAVIQAKEQYHSLKKEIAILIIHGILHLLGYDHEKPADKNNMNAREKAILITLEKELL